MNRRTFFQRTLGGFLAAISIRHGLGGFDTADFDWNGATIEGMSFRKCILYDEFSGHILKDIDLSKDTIKVVLFNSGVRDAQDQSSAPAPMQPTR
jgi:hypothetical protein